MLTFALDYSYIESTHTKPLLAKPMSDELTIAAEMISQADSLLVTAGAGMGAESGLPTFRGNDGFWKAYPALGEAQFNFQSIACPDAFYSHPQLAWGFYAHRLSLYRETLPHVGFDLLKKWGKKKPYGVAVFTSNQALLLTYMLPKSY